MDMQQADKSRRKGKGETVARFSHSFIHTYASDYCTSQTHIRIAVKAAYTGRQTAGQRCHLAHQANGEEVGKRSVTFLGAQ